MKYDNVEIGQIVAVNRGRNVARQLATVISKHREEADNGGHCRVTVRLADGTEEVLNSPQLISKWDDWERHLKGAATAKERNKQIQEQQKESHKRRRAAERAKQLELEQLRQTDRTEKSRYEIEQQCAHLDELGFTDYEKPQPLGTANYHEGEVDGVFMFTPAQLAKLLHTARDAGPRPDSSLPYGTEADWGDDL